MRQTVKPALLGQFLEKLAEAEQQVEICREVLTDNRDFDPFSCFKVLDRRGVGYLIGQDLADFLARNRVAVTQTEAHLLAKGISADTTGKITYPGFVASVLPTDKEIREAVIDRRTVDSLSFRVEYALARLLEREVQLIRELAAIKGNLASDKSLLEHFRSVESDGKSYWTREDLRRFADLAEIRLNEETLKGLFRRLDRDRDGKIGYPEFVDAMLLFTDEGKLAESPQFNREEPENIKRDSFPSKPESPRRLKVSSSLKSLPLKLNRPEELGVMKEERSRQSLDTVPGPDPGNDSGRFSRVWKGSKSLLSKPLQRPQTGKEKTVPAEVVQEDLNDRIPLDDGYNHSSVSNPFKAESNSITPFLSFLKQQIALLFGLEKRKQDLSLCPDFNFFQCFKFFSTDSHSVSLAEFYTGLKTLGVYTGSKEIKNLFLRYDKDFDDRLSFGEFCETIRPEAYEYSNLMRGRRAAQRVFSDRTWECVRRVFSQHIDYERYLIQATGRFRNSFIFAVFESIDVNKLGYFSRKDFATFLKKSEIDLEEAEMSVLMKRYDLNSDGKVTYSELREVLTFN